MEAREQEALLKQRAARYARRAAPWVEEVVEYVAFCRGVGHYALPLVGLREIRPLRHLARIPGASPVVPGVLHFRGELLSAHDLAAWMGHGTYVRPGWTLVVEHGGARLGLLADEVTGIEKMDASRLGPLPVTLVERGVCFRGVLGGHRLLLEPERLFSTPAFFRAF
ncbi:MAG TPA: chemotaxis protein CheW [Myxococcaceae bacterium]|nr:chemotaxis protein CheW [Myxococcaceae bacterium]